MTNAELIQKIRSEIERRKEQAKKHYDNAYSIGRCDAFSEMLNFIYGLEESETPMNLEKMEREEELKKAVHQVSEEIVKEIFPDDLESGDFFTEIDLKNCITRVAYQFADWGAEHTPLPEDTVLFNKGVEEGKRLMMEESVEGEVVKDISNKLAVTAKINLDGFKFGDKVRIIILPKED